MSYPLISALRDRLNAEFVEAHWRSPQRGVVLWKRTIDVNGTTYPEWGVHSFRWEGEGVDLSSGDYFPSESFKWAETTAREAFEGRS